MLMPEIMPLKAHKVFLHQWKLESHHITMSVPAQLKIQPNKNNQKINYRKFISENVI